MIATINGKESGRYDCEQAEFTYPYDLLRWEGCAEGAGCHDLDRNLCERGRSTKKHFSILLKICILANGEGNMLRSGLKSCFLMVHGGNCISVLILTNTVKDEIKWFMGD